VGLNLSEIDNFASTLLEEAKRFLELAKECDIAENSVGCNAFLHSSLMLSFCALEAHVNAVSDEMALTKGLSPHENSILKEREVRLDDGRYKLSKNQLKIFRLEDRILFLHVHFSSKPLDKKNWHPKLKAAIQIRNLLTHPKDATIMQVKDVEASIWAIIETIDALYMAIYKKNFPAKARGLQSKFSF